MLLTSVGWRNLSFAYLIKLIRTGFKFLLLIIKSVHYFLVAMKTSNCWRTEYGHCRHVGVKQCVKWRLNCVGRRESWFLTYNIVVNVVLTTSVTQDIIVSASLIIFCFPWPVNTPLRNFLSLQPQFLFSLFQNILSFWLRFSRCCNLISPKLSWLFCVFWYILSHVKLTFVYGRCK